MKKYILFFSVSIFFIVGQVKAESSIQSDNAPSATIIDKQIVVTYQKDTFCYDKTLCSEGVTDSFTSSKYSKQKNFSNTYNVDLVFVRNYAAYFAAMYGIISNNLSAKALFNADDHTWFGTYNYFDLGPKAGPATTETLKEPVFSFLESEGYSGYYVGSDSATNWRSDDGKLRGVKEKFDITTSIDHFLKVNGAILKSYEVSLGVVANEWHLDTVNDSGLDFDAEKINDGKNISCKSITVNGQLTNDSGSGCSVTLRFPSGLSSLNVSAVGYPRYKYSISVIDIKDVGYPSSLPTKKVSKIAVILPTVSPGQNSQGVLALQNELIAEGYLAPGNNTGFYGPLTISAVAKYQSANSNSTTLINLQPTTPVAGNYSSNVNIGSLLTGLAYGQNSQGVQALQHALIAQGFLAPGNSTGYYGQLTLDAVSKYKASIAPSVVDKTNLQVPKVRSIGLQNVNSTKGTGSATASLTVSGGITVDSGQHFVTYKPGGADVLYKWNSTDADTFSSFFSANNPSQCSTGAWLAKSASGSYSASYGINYIGCVWTVSYTASNSVTGETSTSIVTVSVVGDGTNNSIIQSPPIIKAISPGSGSAGTIVTLTGSGFVIGGQKNYITFTTGNGSGSINLTGTSVDGTSLTFVVPTVNPGIYVVAVDNDSNGYSNTIPFTLVPTGSTNPPSVTYPSTSQNSLNFTLASTNQDRAGTNIFGSDGSIDWGFSADLNLVLPLTVRSIEIRAGNEVWSTTSQFNYPIVVFDGTTQLNYSYGQTIALPAGKKTLTLYAQKWLQNLNPPYTLTFTFTDGSTLSAVLQTPSTITPAPTINQPQPPITLTPVPTPTVTPTPTPVPVVAPTPVPIPTSAQTLNSLSFSLVSTSQDKTGGYTFTSGNGPDWAFNANLNLSLAKTISSMQISAGSETWSTSNGGYYSIVVLDGGTQLNSYYGQTFSLPAGSKTLTLYAQKWIQNFNPAYTLTVFFTDGTSMTSVVQPTTLATSASSLNLDQMANALQGIQIILQRMKASLGL